ncbi:MAG: hypothetical protein F6K41_34090, partial [Symploca sp. SIO3E6]|nr:hypothetical protein [Caldora sp. SIO3E6]
MKIRKMFKPNQLQTIIITAITTLIFLLVSSGNTVAFSHPSYSILRTNTPLVIDGKLDEPAWTAAPDVGDFEFPWWESGKQEQTVSK